MQKHLIVEPLLRRHLIHLGVSMNLFLRKILGPVSFPRKRNQTPAEVLENLQQVKPEDPGFNKVTATVKPSIVKEPDNGIRK
jgi:hypothetical protein